MPKSLEDELAAVSTSGVPFRSCTNRLARAISEGHAWTDPQHNDFITAFQDSVVGSFSFWKENDALSEKSVPRKRPGIFFRCLMSSSTSASVLSVMAAATGLLRATCASHDAPSAVRDIYRDAVTATLARCIDFG